MEHISQRFMFALLGVVIIDQAFGLNMVGIVAHWFGATATESFQATR